MKFDPEKRTWPGRTKNAIAIILLMLVGTLLNHNPPIPYVDDVNPGTDKAILALTNGTRINLSDAMNGLLLKPEGIEITKAEDGTLIYKMTGSKSNASGYSTITTPKGGQYKIILPDGTRVWLNAASSLSFSTSLDSSLGERRTKLIGEAYFEVKKDKAHPFIVMTGKQELEVLGTHFNVSAYPDEGSIRTTLSEGSVRISALLSQDECGALRKTETILRPNQQSALTKNSLQIREVDAESAVAWKNGEFFFHNEALENIMPQISRWYNVEVVYEDKQLAKKRFGCMTSRSEKLSQVLSKLQLTGNAHFKVEGRKIIVTK